MNRYTFDTPFGSLTVAANDKAEANCLAMTIAGDVIPKEGDVYSYGRTADSFSNSDSVADSFLKLKKAYN